MPSNQTSVSADLATDASAGSPAGEPFLQLYLAANLPVLLPVNALVEIMTVSINQIVPMFQMAPWVMGIHNWRGEVLWMVDLNHLLELPPWYQQADYGTKHTAIVLKASSPASQPLPEKAAVVGLVVNRVENMVVCDPETIRSPAHLPDLNPGIQPFLQGYWQASADKLHWILDSTALFSRMTTSDHSRLLR